MSIADFIDLLPQTITLEPHTSEDRYGKPTYGTGVEYRARVVFKQTRIIDQESVEEVPARGHVWIGPPTEDLTDTTPPTVHTRDRITLPDNSQPQVVSVERFPDERGMHHVKVYFR